MHSPINWPRWTASLVRYLYIFKIKEGNIDMWIKHWTDRKSKFKPVNCLNEWIDHFTALWLSYHLPTEDIISGFPSFIRVMWEEMSRHIPLLFGTTALILIIYILEVNQAMNTALFENDSKF